MGKENKEGRMRFEMRLRKPVYLKIQALAKAKPCSMAMYIDNVLEKHYEFMIGKGYYKPQSISPPPDVNTYVSDETPKELSATGKLLAQIEAQKKHGSKL